jgi:hypothetical protein
MYVRPCNAARSILSINPAQVDSKQVLTATALFHLHRWHSSSHTNTSNCSVDASPIRPWLQKYSTCARKPNHSSAGQLVSLRIFVSDSLTLTTASDSDDHQSSAGCRIYRQCRTKSRSDLRRRRIRGRGRNTCTGGLLDRRPERPHRHRPERAPRRRL